MQKNLTKSDRERAKRIIVEIIRQAGGRFENKTNMYKAFWKAHVEFARSNAGHLSFWPIVKMPMGPGIHDFDRLVAELVEEGLFDIAQVQSSDFTAFHFTLDEHAEIPCVLTEAEIEAIRRGVDFVQGRSAAEVSRDSHVESPSWNDAEREGDELNVYVDLVSEEQFQRKKAKMVRMFEAFGD